MTSRFIARCAVAAALLLASAACANDAPSAPQPLPETPAVATVQLDAAAHTMPTGSSRQLIVTVRDAQGAVLAGRAVTWTSSDETIVSVTTTGAIAALRSGTATVRATAGGKSAAATITVMPPLVVRIELDPPTAAVAVDEVMQLTAQPRGDGDIALNRPVTWTTDDASIASVNHAGRVTGHRAGSTWITATVDGISRAALIVVFDWTERPLARVNGAALPVTMFINEIRRTDGSTLRVRVDAHAGAFRMNDNGRWEHAVGVWMHPDGQASGQASYYFRGTYQRDLFTGVVTFYPDGETPVFTGRVHADGTVEFTHRMEPGLPHVTFRYGAPAN